MKLLTLMVMSLMLVSCAGTDTGGGSSDGSSDGGGNYRCEQMTEENKVSGCKIGDWWNFDLLRCNSTEAKCQR